MRSDSFTPNSSSNLEYKDGPTMIARRMALSRLGVAFPEIHRYTMLGETSRAEDMRETPPLLSMASFIQSRSQNTEPILHTVMKYDFIVKG